MTIEFRADGTYHATTEAGVMDGMWTLTDNSHIATWSDERKPKRENEFRFENDELIVVEPGGIAHKHVRVK